MCLKWPENIQATQLALEKAGYICDEEVAVTVFLALQLKKPLLVEGAPGVGKTEIAKALSRILDTDLIRLQCYEGLDENKALYEWNYQRQLLKIQMRKGEVTEEELEKDIFTAEYLLERPLLKAIRTPQPVVLLIDEVDKVDEPFEAFLFELLAEFQITIPEIGTVKARHEPVVVLTSNGERELSDGLKRRCLYLYLDFPTVEREVRIILSRVPEVAYRLAEEIARVAAYMRHELNLKKPPSIAETIDWARALVALNCEELTPARLQQTLNVVLKHHGDRVAFLQRGEVEKALRAAKNS